jgi:hypothetical protein
MMDADHQLGSRLGGYDAELRRHNEVLRRACGIQVRDLDRHRSPPLTGGSMGSKAGCVTGTPA